MSDSPLVSVENLNVRYGKTHAVRDLSFTVHGYTPGRFELVEGLEMPFLGDVPDTDLHEICGKVKESVGWTPRNQASAHGSHAPPPRITQPASRPRSGTSRRIQWRGD